MSRAWRIEYDGAYYHLLSRGNEGRDIFFEKDNRDLLVYFRWRSGRLTNRQIGKLFGLSYSAVSHAVRKLKARMPGNPELKTKFKRLNSQFKL